MHVYRFRILLEDNDQFYREIDVKANQTFEDFHNALVKSAGFDDKEMASFYLCDSKWNKQMEICLCDMNIPEEEIQPVSDEDEDEPSAGKKLIPIKCMSKTKLKDVINDPHQRLIYIYDFLRMHTFYIELYKILSAESGKEYPHVVKSVGKIIHAPTAAMGIAEEDETELALNLSDELGLSTDLEADDPFLDGMYDDSYYN